MGVFDIPAAIDHILKVTSAQKLIYIGYSLGTTVFYAFATNRPEYTDKVLVQISVAPVAAIPRTTSSLKSLASGIEVSENDKFNALLLVQYIRIHLISNSSSRKICLVNLSSKICTVL